MKKHHIKQNSSFMHKEEKSLTADDYINEVCEDLNLPKWAVFLSGLRYREALTQKELGEKIGVAQYNISKMERGLRPIGKNIAQRLSKIFKTDYRLFL